MSASAENINNVFFKGLYKEVWKKLMNPALSLAECDFIIEIAGLKSGDRVLDIMCGQGRHALELSRKGMAVTATDNLEAYIYEIKETTQRENLNISAFVANALDVQLNEKYSAIICMGNSFAFFNKKDAVSLLKKIGQHLLPAGTLIINSWMIAEIAIKHFDEKQWQEVDEYKYLIKNEFLFYPSRIESEHTIIRNDGTIEVIDGVDYIFTLSELEEMLVEAGLKTKALYSTPRKRRFNIGDSSIYIVAEKI